MQTKNKVWRGWSLGLLAVAVLFLLLFSLAQDASAAKKKKYDTWKAVAADMAIEFSRARENVEKGEYKAAHKNMNDAYFGYYEIQGFEKNVMVAISSARVNHIEGKFSAIKHVLLGNNDSMDKATLVNEIEDLKVKVYKDAMVLDGDISDTDPDSLGEAVYGSAGKPAPYGAEAVAADKQAAPETPAVAPADQGAQPARSAAPKRAPVSRDWLTFLTAFGLLVREGLEAILVIVAIVAYLIKTGNKPMIRSVYLGCFAAILASAALAWFLEYMMGDASGVARELLETEETYCAGLRFLVDDCLVPLRTTRLASPATIAAIFLNVEDLLRHSTTLVTTLRAVVSAWDTSSVLAKPFNSLVCNFLSSGVFVFPLHRLCVSHWC